MTRPQVGDEQPRPDDRVDEGHPQREGANRNLAYAERGPERSLQGGIEQDQVGQERGREGSLRRPAPRAAREPEGQQGKGRHHVVLVELRGQHEERQGREAGRLEEAAAVGVRRAPQTAGEQHAREEHAQEAQAAGRDRSGPRDIVAVVVTLAGREQPPEVGGLARNERLTAHGRAPERLDRGHEGAAAEEGKEHERRYRKAGEGRTCDAGPRAIGQAEDQQEGRAGDRLRLGEQRKRTQTPGGLDSLAVQAGKGEGQEPGGHGVGLSQKAVFMTMPGLSA